MEPRRSSRLAKPSGAAKPSVCDTVRPELRHTEVIVGGFTMYLIETLHGPGGGAVYIIPTVHRSGEQLARYYLVVWPEGDIYVHAYGKSRHHPARPYTEIKDSLDWGYLHYHSRPQRKKAINLERDWAIAHWLPAPNSGTRADATAEPGPLGAIWPARGRLIEWMAIQLAQDL